MANKGHIPWNKGKKLSIEYRKKLSEGRMGKEPWNKGLHPEYMQGKNHPMYGTHPVPWNKGKIGVMPTPWNKGLKGFMEGEKHWNWKGDEVGYHALHRWIQRRLAKPLGCNHCGEIKPLDLANKSHEYKRELDDWLWLCKKCHAKYDGYVNKSWITRKGGTEQLPS